MVMRRDNSERHLLLLLAPLHNANKRMLHDNSYPSGDEPWLRKPGRYSHIPVCLVFISGEFSHLCKRVMIAEAETKDMMEEIQSQKKEEDEDEEEGPPPGWESTVLPPPISAVTTAAEISEMAQMVCGSCRRLLSYPRGTKHVKCSCCQTVNLVLEAYQVGQVKCSNCQLLLMYPYGAPSVRCSSCKSVTDVREDNIRPPWSVLQGPLKTFSSVR
uniref:Zinc finger LSD1-type domain-containing protein n=1 Tax=Brassica oleracea TaxID=3712 RepID=A0A3P6BV37_BRAOL|nr:unnamed protein product [Brassica oleracea]